MRCYRRTTRRCAPADLRPDLLAAVRRRLREEGIERLEEDAVYCFETTSERVPQGAFAEMRDWMLGLRDPDGVHYSAVLIGRDAVVWATSGVKRGTTALAARLVDVEARDYDAKLVEDDGVVIAGTLMGSTEAVEAFVGAGEPAGGHLKAALKEAAVRAKGSRQRQSPKAVEEGLRALARLRDDGLVTEEEFDRKRRELLDRL